jgi:hypothetical protein
MLNNNTGGVQATTANTTYYVATTGSDSNSGLAIGTPFLTIAKAISMIPQIVNHTIPIIIAAGTYLEDVSVQGFSGKGFIFLQAAVANALSDSYIIRSFYAGQCTCYVEVNSLKANSTTIEGFKADRSTSINFLYCKMDVASASFGGFGISSSVCQIFNSLISNRFFGISANLSSTVYSNTNSGTGNTTGLIAQAASTIGKGGTQPAGTAAESTSGGGVIR